MEKPQVPEALVKKFTQHTFTDTQSGSVLPYNLYVPPGTGEFPLVLFIHDRGVLSTDAFTTLRQGMGAVTWVREELAREHPCVVLAPQFAQVPFGEDGADMLDTIFRLVEHITACYPVNPARLYVTGQSMGCMSAIAMGIRRPEFFAAYLLVAGQWDPEPMAALARSRMFIVVSQGDPRAYAGMNAALEVMERAGGQISRAQWDQEGGIVPEKQVRALCSQPGNIHYAVLKTEKRDFSCHMDTWKVAYQINGLQRWLLQQHR